MEQNYGQKSIMLSHQKPKLFTSIAQMYRNRGDRLILQSGMSFFHATNSLFRGKYVREAVLFKSGPGNEVETIGER